MDEGEIKRELERGSRNERSKQQEDVDFSIGQTVELDHKPNVMPMRGRTLKIIQVEDGSYYRQREKLQPLEKCKKTTLCEKKESPKKRRE